MIRDGWRTLSTHSPQSQPRAAATAPIPIFARGLLISHGGEITAAKSARLTCRCPRVAGPSGVPRSAEAGCEATRSARDASPYRMLPLLLIADVLMAELVEAAGLESWMADVVIRGADRQANRPRRPNETFSLALGQVGRNLAT
jgi:hypothetical protein